MYRNFIVKEEMKKDSTYSFHYFRKGFKNNFSNQKINQELIVIRPLSFMKWFFQSFMALSECMNFKWQIKQKITEPLNIMKNRQNDRIWGKRITLQITSDMKDKCITGP